MAQGEYASIADVVAAALTGFLSPEDRPSQEQIDRDMAKYLEARERGEPMLSAEEAFNEIIDHLSS